MQDKKLLILVCDGSVRPTNPGPGGFGIIGYSLMESKTPRGIKHPASNKHHFTTKGIRVEKDTSPQQTVEIVEYIGCLPGNESTNNIAELAAFNKSLEIALKVENVGTVKIISDSSYVVKGFNQSLKKWIENGLVTSSGTPLANKELWLSIDKNRQLVRDAGIKIIAEWVKGHNGDYANEIADMYAVVGSNYTIKQLESEEPFVEELYFNIEDMASYRKSFNDISPMRYFKTLTFGSSTDIQDEALYFFSSPKDEEDFGKRTIDGIYVVSHGKPDVILEGLKRKFRNVSRFYNTTCYVDLNRLSGNKELYRLARIIGIDKVTLLVTQYGVTNLHLIQDRSPLVQEYDLTHTFRMEGVNIFNSITDILSMETLPERTYKYDITDVIMGDGKMKVTNRDKTLDLTGIVDKDFKFVNKPAITFGRDIPPYLTIKKYEKEVESIEVIVENRPGSNHVSMYTSILAGRVKLISVNILDKFLVTL